LSGVKVSTPMLSNKLFHAAYAGVKHSFLTTYPKRVQKCGKIDTKNKQQFRYYIYYFFFFMFSLNCF